MRQIKNLRIISLISWADPDAEDRSVKKGQEYNAHLNKYDNEAEEMFAETPGGNICVHSHEYKLIR